MLLTGASSGIGRAAASVLARRGARLALTARRETELRAAADEARAAGGEAVEIVADVADRRDCARAVRETAARLGRVDVLVNNAAIGAAGEFVSQDPDVLESVVRINLLGSMHMMREALPLMKAQGGGLIVNVTSALALEPSPGAAAYSATKAALASLTEALRREVASDGVRLTDFCPGAVVTPMTDRYMGSEGFRRMAYTAEEVAAALADAVESGREQVFYTQFPAFALRLRRTFPAVGSRVMNAWQLGRWALGKG